MSRGNGVAEETGRRRVRAAVDTVRMRALPETQNRLAALILAGSVFYRPSTATWFLQPVDGDDPELRAERGDGRALRTMRSTGLIQVDERVADGREAYPVTMTAAGRERYRSQ